MRQKDSAGTGESSLDCCSILSESCGVRKAAHLWGCSSVGRAPALQAGGHGFESHHLHPGNRKEEDGTTGS